VIGSIREKIKDGVLVDEASLSFALIALRRMTTFSRLSSPRLIA
jgi:hypothetical protein